MKNKITVTSRPYKYLGLSDRTNSIIILGFLLPQIILLTVSKSWGALLNVLCCAAASLCVEFFESRYHHKNDYNFIVSAIQGLLTGLFLPSSFPFYSAFIITLLVFLLCKYFAGDFSDSWINLPALTVCICWILGGKLFPSFQISGEVLMSKNPSLTLINSGVFPVNSADARITAFFNKTVFSLFGVSIPEGYVSLLWDNHSLIPAFRFNFITLITSIILFSLDTVKVLIPGVFILVYGLLVLFAGPLIYSAVPGQGDLLLAFCTSGIFMSSLFLLQFAGTVPMTVTGKAVYAVSAGISAFFIIGAGTSPAGAVFTVLLMNAFSPVIQHFEHFVEMKNVKNNLLDKVSELKEGTNA